MRGSRSKLGTLMSHYQYETQRQPAACLVALWLVGLGPLRRNWRTKRSGRVDRKFPTWRGQSELRLGPYLTSGVMQLWTRVSPQITDLATSLLGDSWTAIPASSVEKGFPGGSR
jgi:hypothetical protein